MTANLTKLPTNCPVLRDAFDTISAIAVEAVWLPNQAKAITLPQAQTALRDLHHRLPRLQDLRVFEPAVTAYVSTLRSSMQDGDTPLCDTTRARLAQATELLGLVRNQTRTVVDPADPWRGLYHPSRLPARTADGEIPCHPDAPMWADGREVSLRPLFLAQGFDLVVVEGEFSDDGIGSGVYSAAHELHDWNPEAPGEGWRIAWLGETEDGLAAWFVRPLAIAAMNRPTAAPTLADAQPGGRVRLGGAPWPEIDVILADAYSAGAEGLPFEGIARRAAVRKAIAALSAQPSPGGQGDSRSERAATFLRQHLTYLRSSPRQGLRPRWCDVYEALEVAIEALAARQPVGEVIEYQTNHVNGGWAKCDKSHYDDGKAYEAAYPRQRESLYRTLVVGDAALPAQAVDLGTGIKAIASERERQLCIEGFSRDSDEQYREGELARAATAYVQLAAMDLQVGSRKHIASQEPPFFWPWAQEWWKPVDARRDLVRAGALIAAQIDLIDSQAVGNG